MKRRQRERIERALRLYLELLRRVAHRRRRHLRRDPCSSCAFRPRPRGGWRGAERTAINLFRILHGKGPRTFLCHVGLQYRDGDWQVPTTTAEWARARPCAGYEAIEGSSLARGAMQRACAELRATGRPL